MDKHTVPVQARYNFTITPDGDKSYTVKYTKPKYNLSMLTNAIVYFGLASFIPAGFAQSTPLWILLTFVLPVVLFIIANTRRKEGVFRITPTEYIVDGTHYDRRDVNDLFIKVPYEKEQVAPVRSGTIIGVAYSGGGIHGIGMGAAVATTAVIAGAMKVASDTSRGAINKIKQQYIRKNFSIGFLYGEKKIPLAKGLSDHTAGVLFQKVAEISAE